MSYSRAVDRVWKTSRRQVPLDRPLVMGILNVTPDSFSDGGRFAAVDSALRHAEQMIADGADIIDVGGESTRPGAKQLSAEEEAERVVPVIRHLTSQFDIPVSIDTTKSEVAKRAIDAGAEIVNDISGLRWDAGLADIAAASGAGLILMHSRGEFDTMHSQEPVDDIVTEVVACLRVSLAGAAGAGVTGGQIALDVGVGFGKTLEQNLELMAKLDKIVNEFKTHPIVVGASRKSFIGRITESSAASDRLGGSLAAAMLAMENGAHILRVHDVKETVAACRMFSAVSQLK